VILKTGRQQSRRQHREGVCPSGSVGDVRRVASHDEVDIAENAVGIMVMLYNIQFEFGHTKRGRINEYSTQQKDTATA
jgi:hypothetical protein